MPQGAPNTAHEHPKTASQCVQPLDSNEAYFFSNALSLLPSPAQDGSKNDRDICWAWVASIRHPTHSATKLSPSRAVAAR
eukprot:1499867-Pyramimonas_sp.AAC.1